MRYSSLLTRQLAVFSILFSVALAFSVALGSPTSASASASASASVSVSVLTTVATNQPTCLGVGASVIPALGVGPNPGAAEDLGFDSSSDSTDGSYDGASTSRRGLKSGQMNDLLYERQYDSSDASDGSMGASDGSTDASDGSTGASTPAPLAGTPIQIPPNTTYCGWLGGTGMQSDMLLFNNPGTYQLTWQNVTGDGQVSINYAAAGADSTWANQDTEELSDLPTIVAFPGDGVQYQVVYYGAYAINGLSWFLTQVA